jgi:hypothetical protein
VTIGVDLSQIVDELSRAFPAYPRNALEGLVGRCAAQFAGATVQAFVPVLIRRAAREQLTYLEQGASVQLAQAQAPAPTPTPTPTQSQALYAQ